MKSIYDAVIIGGVAGPALFTTPLVTTITGESIDTKGYNTGVLRVRASAFNTPLNNTIQPLITVNNGASVTAVLEESADNSTWSSALNNSSTQIGTTGVVVTATAVVGSARIEGLGGLNRMRYLRVKLTANFGSPNVNKVFTAFGAIELGNAFRNPVTTETSIA